MQSYLRGYKRLKEEDSPRLLLKSKMRWLILLLTVVLSSLMHQPEEIWLSSIFSISITRILNLIKPFLIAHNHPQNFNYPFY